MEQLRIYNARLLMPGGIVEGGVLAAGGRIVEAGRDVKKSSGCREIDAYGRYLAPGFIDLHVHGGGGYDFMDGTVEAFLGAAKVHAAHGSTTILPTTLTCADDELFAAFAAFRQARSLNTEGAGMPGIHLEGPYFSMEQRGAQDTRYIVSPTSGHYNRILREGVNDILRWSMAPELPGMPGLAVELVKRGILPSIAHTDAFFEQIEEAMAWGFTHLTHFYSGMQGIRRIKGMRYAGAVEAAYVLDGLTVEVIADGIHLPPPLLKMVFKNIGPGRAALITDAMRAAGTECRTSMLGSKSGGMEVLVEGGVAWLKDRSAFAGSVCTMDRAVRMMVRKIGVPLTDAVMMATATPAKIMGMRSKGSLVPGMDADLVMFDEDIYVSYTVVGGRVIFSKGYNQ